MAADLLDSYFSENRVAPYFGWRQMGAAESSPPICSLCLLTNAGADATASGSRRGRMRAETRLHAARRSLASWHRHLPKKKRDSSISFSKEMFNGYRRLGRGCNFALVSRRGLVWRSSVALSCVWNARQRVRLHNQNC
jgi:hypothetical protein